MKRVRWKDYKDLDWYIVSTDGTYIKAYSCSLVGIPRDMDCDDLEYDSGGLIKREQALQIQIKPSLIAQECSEHQDVEDHLHRILQRMSLVDLGGVQSS